MKIEVLDKGYIELVDTLGDDLTPVNAARVSFGGRSKNFENKDVVGIETTSNHPTKDHAWNEISGRYVAYDEFYEPTEFRKQSDDNKQASDGLVDNQKEMKQLWTISQQNSISAYKEMLNNGMAKEQARSILPLTVYTKVWWTASFQSVMNFIELRDEPTSQVEIQDYARVLKDIMLEAFPETTKLWLEVYGK